MLVMTESFTPPQTHGANARRFEVEDFASHDTVIVGIENPLTDEPCEPKIVSIDNQPFHGLSAILTQAHAISSFVLTPNEVSPTSA
jgi:hypothetical protein